MNTPTSINPNKAKKKAKKLSMKAYLVGLSIGIVIIGIPLSCKYYLHNVCLEGYAALWIQLLIRIPLVLFLILGSIALFADKKKRKYRDWIWISIFPVIPLFFFYNTTLPYLMDLCINKTIAVEISDYKIFKRSSKYDFPYHLRSEIFANKIITSMPGEDTEIILSEKRYDEIKLANEPSLKLEVYPYSKLIKEVIYIDNLE